jgi:hypothetical protein
MATRYWLGSINSDLNDASNYSGSGALLTSDALIYDSTSSVDATATASLSVQSVTVSSSYSGSFKDMGQSMTISQTVTVFNTGASSGSFIISGDWGVTGSWTFGANGTIQTSGSTVTFQGTTLSTVTLAGNSLNNVVCNKTATAGVTFSGSVNLTGNLTVSDTNNQAISWTGTTLTTTGNITMGGTGAYNYGNGVTMNGSGTTFWIKSTVGTQTASSCDLTVNSTDIEFIMDKDVVVNTWSVGVIFRSLTLGASSSLVINGSKNFSLNFTGGIPLVIGSNSVFTANTEFYFLAGGSYSFMTLGSNIVFNGIGKIVFANWNATVTCSIPAVTYTGSGYWIILKSNYGQQFTVNLAGDLDLGVADFYSVGSVNSNAVTFNTNGYNLTCYNIRSGRSSALYSHTCNYGASEVRIKNFDGNYWTAGCILNLQSSQWYCDGTVIFRNNHTVNSGTSKIFFTGDSTITFAASNQSLYDIEVNTPGKGLYVGGTLDLICHDFIVTDGNFSIGGNALISSGNVLLNSTGSIDFGTNGNTLEINGSTIDHTMAISNTLSSVVPNFSIFFNSNKTLYFRDNYGITGLQLETGSSSTLVVQGSKPSTFGGGTPGLYIGSAGTAILETDMTLLATGNIDIFSHPGSLSPTITGRDTTLYMAVLNSSGSTFRMDVDYTGNLTLFFDSSTTSTPTWNFYGSQVTFPDTYNIIFKNSSTGQCTYNIVSRDIFGYPNLKIISKNYNKILLTLTDPTLQFSNWSEEDSSGSTINWASSDTTLSGSFIGCRDSTYTTGTGKINFIGDGIINCFDKTAFYDMTVNAPDKTLTCVNNFHTQRNLSLIQGNFYFSDYTTSVGGNALFDGTGSLGLGTIITKGANSTLYISNSLSNVDSSQCSITVDGTTAPSIDIDKSISVKSISLGNSAKCTNRGDGTVSLIGSLPWLLKLGNDATLTNNSALELHANQTSSIISTGNRTIINGSAPITTFIEAPSIIGTLTDVTYSGTAGWGFYDNTGYDSTITFNGNFNIGNNNLYMYLSGYPSARNKWAVNKDISCENLMVGRDNSNGGSLTVEYGKGTINLASYATPNFTGTSLAQYFQHSNWNCSKDWTFGSGASQVFHMTDTFNFNGPGNITTNGIPFNWLKINSDSTMMDDLSCHWIKNIGTLNQNGHNLRLIGDTHGISYSITS